MAMKNHPKLFLFFSFLFLGTLFAIAPAFATSGACSWHGGVNCSVGPSLGGYAQCYDGSISSVPYSMMSECNTASLCPQPLAIGCTDESQLQPLEDELNNAQQSCNAQNMRSGGGCVVDPSLSQQIQYCEQGIQDYQAEVQSYNQCISDAQTQAQQQTALQTNLQLDLVCASHYGSSHYNASSTTLCSCDSGYMPGPNGKCELGLLACKQLLGSNTTFANNQCACANGYTLNSTQTQCVIPNGAMVNGGLQCNAGYVDYQGSCMDATSANNLANDLCYGYTHFSGIGAAGTMRTDGSLACSCDTGSVWNASTTRCDLVPATTAPTGAVKPSVESPPPAISSPVAVITQNISVGTSGQNVVALQNFLESKGFFTLPAGTTKGYFGNLTKLALIAFQKSAGLPPTGWCGPMTRAAINAQ